MKLNRDLTNKVNWILDNVLPPFLRDSKLFMTPLFWLLFRDKRKFFMDFKDKAPFFSKEEYEKYYEETLSVHIHRETDLNKECIESIIIDIEGDTVLDVGSGRGYLANTIISRKKVKATGLDIYIPENLRSSENPKFVQGNTEELPFKDKSFDTVVCTHTIEHVQDPHKAVAELRRVAKKRVIIVVPRQRPNRYTFDLHLNFFPYIFSLQRITQNPEAKCLILNNDLYYSEEIK